MPRTTNKKTEKTRQISQVRSAERDIIAHALQTHADHRGRSVGGTRTFDIRNSIFSRGYTALTGKTFK